MSPWTEIIIVIFFYISTLELTLRHQCRGAKAKLLMVTTRDRNDDDQISQVERNISNATWETQNGKKNKQKNTWKFYGSGSNEAGKIERERARETDSANDKTHRSMNECGAEEKRAMI